MKIYFIDKKGRNFGIARRIMEKGFSNLEVKDTYTFRSTKADYVVLSEFDKHDNENEILSKYNNLILITEEIDQKSVCEYIKNYKVIDIISGKLSQDYIAERIIKKLV